MTKLLRCLVVVALFVATPFLHASTNGLVISQVYGGGGNSGATYRNDFIEVFNGGSAPVSLAGYSVQYAATTGQTWAVTTLTAVTLQPGQYYLVRESAGTGGTTDLPTPDASGNIAMSATAGKVALVSQTTPLSGAQPASPAIVDVVGFGNGTNYSEGNAPTPTLSNSTAALRKSNGCVDTDNNANDFSVVPPTPRNTSSPVAACGGTTNAPIVTNCPSFTTVSGSGGSSTMSASDADGRVNAVVLSNQPAGITLGTFSPATAAGGTASVPVNVSPSVAPGSYTITLTWGNDQSQSATCTPTVTVGALTPIPSIQGSGSTSPFANQRVITQGVVTRLVNNGFYMQDPVGDDDPNTSDGIFVFTSTAPTVALGDLARVSATVTEFNTGAAGNADTASHTITELSSVTGVSVQSSGNSIAPIAIAFPFASRDELEKYEHMLVTINGPFTVAQNAFLGQYGQITVAAQGAVETPTNRLRPGASAQALYADNKRRSLVLEDGLSTQYPNPTPFLGQSNTTRAGDTTASLTGVIDYGLTTSSSSDPGSWRLIPTVAPTFTRANARTTAPDDVGGTVRVAAANVLNFFTTFTNGQTADGMTGQGCTVGSSTSAGNCRGADNLTEFQRQRTKIVEELAAINADVVGLMEIQNNGPTAVQNLVDALNARVGANTYAVVPDPSQGTGTDAIKVAMIYKPARVTRASASISDADPVHNRPPLAQSFSVPGGQIFTLVVNHLKSKSCSGATGADADQGDLQSCYNATRVAQARRTRTWVASLFPNNTTLPNVLLVGDFNSYAQEDPIIELTSNGYVDQVGRYNSFGYSYVFDGSAGRLDQALASQVLSSKITRALEWHNNADEPEIIDYNLENKQPACATCSPDYYTPTPYRASDHDPVVIGISLPPPVAPPPRR